MGLLRLPLKGTYNISLDMIGEYANRPPVAVFGVQGTGLEAFSQGGCPAVLNYGNPPEYTVEANDPSGLKMYLQSFSTTLMVSGLGQSGIDQWFQSRNSEPLKFIAEGRRIGPMLFEFGSVHHLMLETTDRLGVSDTADCDFRVVDRTPPTVTPPGATVVDATVAGGATPSTSTALEHFSKGLARWTGRRLTKSVAPIALTGSRSTLQPFSLSRRNPMNG